MDNETQIQKEVKDHVIVFMDKSVKFITKMEAEKIDIVSSTPGTNITGIDLLDGGHYKFSMMAKVVSQKDYYEQYPMQRPSENTPEFNSKQIMRDFKPIRRARALRSLASGMQRFIDSKGGEDKVLPKTRELLHKIEHQTNEATYEKR